MDRFYRTQLLLGKKGLALLKEKWVAVFGLGGVGSFAVEGLVRAGIGTITIVDFDTIGETNINRQLTALSTTIGRSKVEVMAERIVDINPSCKVFPHKAFFDNAQIETLLAEKYDLVIDAIDSFNPKITLLVASVRKGLPVISGMGAAAKINPALIRIGDISESHICPFARRVRKRLKDFGISRGIPVVYSIEPPIMPYSPEIIPEEKREVTLSRGRPRMIQASICHIPAIFGMTLAGMAIQKLTGYTNACDIPKDEEI